MHTFLLYLLYVPARPILVISIHVNKAFQLFNLVLFVSSGTNTFFCLSEGEAKMFSAVRLSPIYILLILSYCSLDYSSAL